MYYCSVGAIFGVGEQTTMKLIQTLVAPQGSWKWQQRLRYVQYSPVLLKSGRVVWGKSQTINNGVPGGNIKGGNYSTGQRSRYMKPLTPCELWCSAVPVEVWQ